MTFNAESFDQTVREDGLIKRGCECFLYVAFISLFNSIFYVFDFRLDFLIRLWGGLGLGVTELISVLARRAGGVVPILALILNLILSGAFIVFWYFARKGHLGAFCAGSGLFALDGIWILSLGQSLMPTWHSILFPCSLCWQECMEFPNWNSSNRLSDATDPLGAGPAQSECPFNRVLCD
jgi:hypothetical protein